VAHFTKNQRVYTERGEKKLRDVMVEYREGGAFGKGRRQVCHLLDPVYYSFALASADVGSWFVICRE